MPRDTTAVICDLDGTLIDNEEIHLKAWCDIVGGYGYTFPDGWELQYLGNPDPRWATHCVATYPSLPDADTLLDERHRHYRKLLQRRGAETAFPGVREALEQLSALGFKMGVGTNSPLENTVDALVYADIDQFFPVVVAYDSTRRPKPFPDIFLAVAEKLGANPAQCVIVEDSVPGVQAGKAAGALVLGLTTSNPEVAAAGADLTFATTRAALDWILANCRPA